MAKVVDVWIMVQLPHLCLFFDSARMLGEG